MGERKVLNKYIPANFDPKLVPRGTKPKDDLIPVRMMLPFSVQCKTCSSFMYRGRKFNSKKEAMKGPNGKYLGIQRFRFYIKCTSCSRPVTFLTDPKNTDYEMESGATRNYEVHKDRVKTEEEVSAEKKLKEKEDPMKALENRVLASQREMADLDNLDEIKAMNMRHLKLMSTFKGKEGLASATSMLARKNSDEKKNSQDKLLELDEEDEAFVRSIQFGKQKKDPQKGLNEMEENRLIAQKLLEKQQFDISKKVKKNRKPISHLKPVMKAKRKRKGNINTIAEKKQIIEQVEMLPKKQSNSKSEGVFGLLGGYGSDSS